jgi:hypothetical protein
MGCGAVDFAGEHFCEAEPAVCFELRVCLMGPWASCGVRQFLILAILIVLPGCAQETNSPTPQAPETDKAVNVNWLYGAFVPKDVPLVPLTGRQRFRLYLAQSFTTPGIYIKSTVFSLSAQASNSPPEWGDGFAGYGRRWGSRYGQSLIQNTLSSTGNALLGYEPRYDRCRCTGLWPRTRHAFLRNFVTYNRTEKELRPQFALYAAALGSGAISTVWYPSKTDPWVEGYQAMILQAGWGMASNWVGEFAPEIERIVKRKKASGQP